MKRPGPRRRGMALLAVLWVVAAMGLAVTGIVQMVRSEIKAAGLQRQILVASAKADAFILLALQNMQAAAREPGGVPQQLMVKFEAEDSAVSVLPLNGLIDINSATVKLLTEMYRHVGGLSQPEAQTLAQATLQTRQVKSAKGVQQNFDAAEDLLQVPGMTYDLYAKLDGLVTADLRNGSGRVSALAAPQGVLQILASGNMARASVLAAQRSVDAKAMDTSFLDPELVDMAPTSNLRLQTQVALPGDGYLQQTWLVYWAVDPRSGLPWRVLGKQQTVSRTNLAGG
jgi:general secretion pathway protein K